MTKVVDWPTVMVVCDLLRLMVADGNTSLAALRSAKKPNK